MNEVNTVERPVMPVARRMRSAVGGEHWNVITEEDLAQQPEWVREMWANGAELLYSQAALDALCSALQEIATHSVCCDAKHTAVAALRHNAAADSA
jgi:hypothetical protein